MEFPITPASAEDNLTISFPAAGFSDFITSLLGKRQSISYRSKGSFEINIDSIQSLYSLLSTRISEQNNADLIQFTVRINYTDGSSVEISSIDQLVKYAEVRPLIVASLILGWTYLITFHGKLTPEKQTITYEYRVKNYEKSEGLEYGRFSLEESRPLQSFSNERPFTGRINFRISHTVRSWATDIENLLINHTTGTYKDFESKFQRISRVWSPQISFLIWMISFSIFISFGRKILSYIITNALDSAHIKAMESFQNFQNLSRKLDFLIKYSFSEFNIELILGMILYLFISLSASILIVTFITEHTKNQYPSFIILSENGRSMKDKILNEYNSNWTKYVIGILLNITLSVIANAIFLIF